jgi:hypothetical protein
LGESAKSLTENSFNSDGNFNNIALSFGASFGIKNKVGFKAKQTIVFIPTKKMNV